MPSFGQLGIGTPEAEATWFGTHGLSRAGLHCHIITHWTNKMLKIKLVNNDRSGLVLVAKYQVLATGQHNSPKARTWFHIMEFLQEWVSYCHITHK
jgi:hypothetical protein